MSLTITEAWIRDRVQLNHDNLEDVRSLSLPGTYQEKIGNLGSALFSFTRLKQLDLSRNGLQSLQGLHHLRVLEKLNLYYNNISSLQELSRLRHNTNLQELDLRLNPVTKNEPDYRLYLVHMLPNLRKLDDRSVRESERKSALLHFDSDQATAMTERSASPAREGSRPEPPRPRHVRGLGSRSALEDDDSDLLDLLARTDGDLSKPRPVTGSAAGNPSVDIQPPSAQGYQRTPPRTRLGSSGAGQLTDRHRNLPQTDDWSPELLDPMVGVNTSTASDSTGSLIDADPLDHLNGSALGSELSPFHSPSATLPPRLPVLTPPKTLHDAPPSPTDTNTLIDDIHGHSPLSLQWQPSNSVLEERALFDREHRDLLSPTDTSSLIDEAKTNFGTARLSFSPLGGKKKLDFDQSKGDDLASGSEDGLLSTTATLESVLSQRSLSRLSEKSDYASLPTVLSRSMVSQFGEHRSEIGLLKAGDIYSSIMSQSHSRSWPSSQAGLHSTETSPGTRLTSQSHSSGTSLTSTNHDQNPTPVHPSSPTTLSSEVGSLHRNQNQVLVPSCESYNTKDKSPTRQLASSDCSNLSLSKAELSSSQSNSESALTSVLKSPSKVLIIPASPLAKESKKSVTFMLGGDKGDHVEQESNVLHQTTGAQGEMHKVPASPDKSPLRQSMDHSDSLHERRSVQTDVGFWSPSLNRNNSNANEGSFIHTSALQQTPVEDRYSNVVLGRDGDSLDLNEKYSDNENQYQRKLLFDESTSLGSVKSDFKSTTGPIRVGARGVNGNTSVTLEFRGSAPMPVQSPSVSQSPRVSGSNTLIHPPHHSHTQPTNLFSPPASTNRIAMATPPDSPRKTTTTTTTNKGQGLVILDRPFASSSSRPFGVGSERRRLIGPNSDSSPPHHVHHLLTPAPEPSNHLPDLERSQGQQRSKFTEVTEMDRGQVDSNLRFTDENDAYTAYSSKVNFTPNPKPGGRAESVSSYDLHPSSTAAENFDEPPPIQRVSQQKPASSSQGANQSAFLDHLLNLVDRYWNGSKSLHSHSKFQAQAQALLDKTLGEAQATNQEHMDRLQLDVARYAQENVALRNRLGGSGGGGGARGQPEVQRALEKSQKDVGMLQQELREVTAENQELQAQLMEARRQAAETASLAPREPKDSSSSSDRLLQENERLKLQLKHFSQLQELATMLQESHKSLVTTNDHLLKELEETKLRHREEVKQLHWSYTQLKQTMDIMPPSHTPLHTPSHTPSAPSNGGMDRGEGGSSNTQAGYESYSPGKKVKGFSYSNGAM